MTPFYPGLVAVEMLRALGQGAAISTGVNDGVEYCVRSLAKQAGLEVGVMPGGKPEFDARHAAVAAAGMRVVAIHLDPQASSVVKSLMREVPDDRIDLRTMIEVVEL